MFITIFFIKDFALQNEAKYSRISSIEMEKKMKLNGFFLNVFDDISNWFFRVTSNITFKGQVIPFLFGIVFGIIIFGLMYVLFVFATFKKNEKKSKGYVEISDEKILQIIQNSKNKFLEESSMKPLSEKYQDVAKISWEVICDIASTIYPDSKHPLFELTSNEFLLLIHYISDRLKKEFQAEES